jgi:hypothetical protein
LEDTVCLVEGSDWKKHFVSFKFCVMNIDREVIDENLKKLKSSIKNLPASEKRIIYWILLRETLRKDFDGVMWLYDEMSRFVDREFAVKGYKRVKRKKGY